MSNLKEAGNYLPMEFKDSENRTIRAMMVNDEPVFIAKDLCEALGISQYRNYLKRQLDEDERGLHLVHTLGGKQTFSTVNESGFYSLVFQSRKPYARKIRKWVTSEVLPTLRKTGKYELQNMGQSMYVLNTRFYDYKKSLAELGMSTHSGNFHRRIEKYRQHFILSEEGGHWLITEEYLKVIKNDKLLRDSRQQAKLSDTVVKYVHPALRPHMQLSLFDEAENARIILKAIQDVRKEMKDGSSSL